MRKTHAIPAVLAATVALSVCNVLPADAAGVAERSPKTGTQRAFGLDMAAAQRHKQLLKQVRKPSTKENGAIRFRQPKGILKAADQVFASRPKKGGANTAAALFTQELNETSTAAAPAALPSSFSLKQYANPPGDQGAVGSCVAWATGYSAYGIIMNEMGIQGHPMAPMYLYSQINGGRDAGSFAARALPMLQQAGQDTKADYVPQGDFDWRTPPTQAQRQNASQYKLSGFWDLESMPDRKTAVMQAISSGLPVPIGFNVTAGFQRVGADGVYTPTGGSMGGHEVTIVGYDEQGVEVMNSWGTRWGNGGFFKGSWEWLQSRDITEINAMGALVKA